MYKMNYKNTIFSDKIPPETTFEHARFGHIQVN